MDAPFLTLFPPAALYAETHYRFPFFPFSLYYRRQPEIIFDAPQRLEPGMPLPVTLIVKDADRFPIELEEITLTAPASDGGRVQQQFRLNHSLQCSFWHHIFDLEIGELSCGSIALDCALTFKVRGRRRIVRNDNHVWLSHGPLRVFKAEHPLPLLPGWAAGELHCHTSYGSDYVEFGAPLEAIRRTAGAMGLAWTALTDHSYNLDDLPNDYRKADAELVKWRLLWEEAERLNGTGGVVLLPGEELTCRNARGRNVHMLVIGNRRFLPGSGDGAEQWFRTRSELSVAEALALVDDNVFVAAAHPLVPTPLLERVLVGRGEWLPEDLAHPRLNGWQVANGGWGVDFRRGYDAWVKALTAGKQICIFGGNDAHGNFNRFRQVRLPMARLWERDRHVFGRFTTRVKTEARDAAGIIAALKESPVVLSDGPTLELEAIQSGDRRAIRLRWLTTPEFGTPREIAVFLGSEGSERRLALDSPPARLTASSGELELAVPQVSNIRAELRTQTAHGGEHRCYTNPIGPATLGGHGSP